MDFGHKHVVIDTPAGPVELDVYTVPESAFADLRAFGALGDFEPVELPDPGLS
jgi:hypothetical protein